MTSQYKTTIIPVVVVVVYLLFCLFITSASADSFIRQFTDGFNTNPQQESAAGAVPNQDKAHYLHKNHEISSGDYKVLSSNALQGMRNVGPSSYSLKMESFNTLLQSTYAERYESRPFAAGGYNWTLIVYPNGNKKDSGAGYLSLYVAIDNSSFVAGRQEVYADLRFYVFNNNQRKYFTIQDTALWRFTAFKTMWGFSQVLAVNTFKDPRNGYLYDGDHCEFGVDVTFPSHFEKSELFTVTKTFTNPRFTWEIRGFSMLFKEYYLSDTFTIGDRNWNIKVYPNGYSTGQGKALSLFLALNENEKFRPYENIYVRAKLRVLNQRQLSNVERQLDTWYSGPEYSGPGYAGYSWWGWYEFISLSDLKFSSKGYLVNDVLKVQVEMEALSSTTYLP